MGRRSLDGRGCDGRDGLRRFFAHLGQRLLEREGQRQELQVQGLEERAPKVPGDASVPNSVEPIWGPRTENPKPIFAGGAMPPAARMPFA